MKIVNKKALHNYHILEHLEAGLVLSGAEVKSIRSGRTDLGEAYVKIIGDEAYLVNANIPKFGPSGDREYDATKSRKLLLHKSQIITLLGKTSGKGLALIPVSIYEKNNNFKVDVGLAKSKKEFDKRHVIKERDHIRRVEQELRGKE
ncbi:SsrA-binding protein [Candidatus Daviesbacteria bacterium RIFCSPHIGHO2_12_FULL_37_11]|uniref:SsrA-binding protein n=1 Tax=Candidatus Daviesbacteria bacterium RIFCSPHIGHO2_12_FULL_37_11 TaxID=1797777 RepID=A0A1F5KCG0_9BACT|nr:MAG: SsrA-binding protein [Candidatus Daviesbacteria bacterium RIFCSPHIGHO2_01_FULL_37_27]OGE38455.1 MAG: SsrA-binding protein [Candidatus Daviesbacteria bacterium RIFCSPHIGHO2_12_FULL_37_11]OGE45765.1 MAG: SsrA-binding protein [Candidatus Daviesbacteria bacterium RIFCSPLOWO2_01_FULL_37_10]